MKKKNPSLSGFIVAAAGVLMMAFGIYRGETEAIFAKAVRICLECIGIG